MKIVQWVNFTWDLAKGDLPALKPPASYNLRLTGPEDYEKVKDVIRKSLTLDPAWNFALKEIDGAMLASFTRALAVDSAACLTVRHGSRIIGGTFVLANAGTNEHFVPGPCILVEYRNRGLGTLLLQAALLHLRQAEIRRAVTSTSDTSLAARFLYPKFGGKASPFAPLLAA